MNLANQPTGDATLKRELGVFGATMLGMGSIVGTGVFVSIGISAGIAGPAVILAILLAGLLATCNALSSAQLAANHPVSGGTYEYGYHYLTPSLGFIAGWTFLFAKSASAATAALGFAGYLLHAIGAAERGWLMPIAVMATLILTLIVLAGLSRANWANILIVSVTLGSLGLFVVAGIPTAIQSGKDNLFPFFDSGGNSGWDDLQGLLQASALMFVAYTGYGRIATLGEEVHDPRKTIPRAIVTTLTLSAAIYLIISIVSVSVLGAEALGEATRSKAAPLEIVARKFQWPAVHWIVAIGAMTAMLGVLLNLILGLSRVLFAMGRRRDMPSIVTKVSSANRTPWIAISVIGLIIGGLAATGSVQTTWSFSAFTVLVYYAITNLAAIRLRPEDRLYHPVFAWAGLAGCLGLAFWVEQKIWIAGLLTVGVGWVFHKIAVHLRTSGGAENKTDDVK